MKIFSLGAIVLEKEKPLKSRVKIRIQKIHRMNNEHFFLSLSRLAHIILWSHSHSQKLLHFSEWHHGFHHEVIIFSRHARCIFLITRSVMSTQTYSHRPSDFWSSYNKTMQYLISHRFHALWRGINKKNIQSTVVDS